MRNRVGVIARLQPDGASLEQTAEFGLQACQLVCWKSEQMTEEAADRVRAESQERGVRVTSFWVGWPGPAAWNFEEGPETLGIVPRKYRAMRVEALKQGAAFAHRAGLAAIVTHLGFIPENPGDTVFGEVVDAVRELADRCGELGIEFWFETGQETPVAMLRLIEAVGTGNLGVNLDPANLILYGKANPVDSLDVFGRYVRSVHAKDGLYPTDPMKLGREVRVGEGRVGFPQLVRRLHELDYDGAYIIEREIAGPQQSEDIRATVVYLRNLLGEIQG